MAKITKEEFKRVYLEDFLNWASCDKDGRELTSWFTALEEYAKREWNRAYDEKYGKPKPPDHSKPFESDMGDD